MPWKGWCAATTSPSPTRAASFPTSWSSASPVREIFRRRSDSRERLVVHLAQLEKKLPFKTNIFRLIFVALVFFSFVFFNREPTRSKSHKSVTPDVDADATRRHFNVFFGRKKRKKVFCVFIDIWSVDTVAHSEVDVIKLFPLLRRWCFWKKKQPSLSRCKGKKEWS